MMYGITRYITKNIPNAFFLWKTPFPTKSMDKLKDLENFCTCYFAFSSSPLGHKAEMFPSGSFRKEKRGGERDLICQKGEEGSFSLFFQWGKGRWVEGKISLFGKKAEEEWPMGPIWEIRWPAYPILLQRERKSGWVPPPSSQFFFRTVFRCLAVRDEE